MGDNFIINSNFKFAYNYLTSTPKFELKLNLTFGDDCTDGDFVTDELTELEKENELHSVIADGETPPDLEMDSDLDEDGYLMEENFDSPIEDYTDIEDECLLQSDWPLPMFKIVIQSPPGSKTDIKFEDFQGGTEYTEEIVKTPANDRNVTKDGKVLEDDLMEKNLYNQIKDCTIAEDEEDLSRSKLNHPKYISPKVCPYSNTIKSENILKDVKCKDKKTDVTLNKSNINNDEIREDEARYLMDCGSPIEDYPIAKNQRSFLCDLPPPVYDIHQATSDSNSNVKFDTFHKNADAIKKMTSNENRVGKDEVPGDLVDRGSQTENYLITEGGDRLLLSDSTILGRKMKLPQSFSDVNKAFHEGTGNKDKNTANKNNADKDEVLEDEDEYLLQGDLGSSFEDYVITEEDERLLLSDSPLPSYKYMICQSSSDASNNTNSKEIQKYIAYRDKNIEVTANKSNVDKGEVLEDEDLLEGDFDSSLEDFKIAEDEYLLSIDSPLPTSKFRIYDSFSDSKNDKSEKWDRKSEMKKLQLMQAG